MSTPETPKPGTHAWWFSREQDRAKTSARRALEFAAKEIEDVLSEWDTKPPGLIARCARLVTAYGTEAAGQSGAIKALENVAHLIAEPPKEG